jgi:VIT1/CCC1 family predicted Fe2+/Mn2+ transporter
MSLYLSEFVYGGIDGIITTFSIVAGSSGGSLLRNVILILGLSNVVSDGFSMGVSRYVSSKTEIKQELLKEKDPTISAIVTFLSFVLVGILPLLPFIFMRNSKNNKNTTYISLSIALVVFFSIGYLKGIVVKEKNPYKSAFEILLLGLIASLISYTIGKYTSKYIK